MKINRNSLHYRLARVYGPMSYSDESNVKSICDYNKYVILGIIMMIICIIIGSLLSTIFLLYPILGLISYFYFGLTPIELNEFPLIIIGSSVDIISLLGIGVIMLYDYSVKDKMQEIKHSLSTKFESSYVYSGWKSFKDKVCIHIEFED